MAANDTVRLSRENYVSLVRDSAILYDMVSAISTLLTHTISENLKAENLLALEVVEQFQVLAQDRATALQEHIDQVEAMEN